jgi:hypothetical protein
VKSAKLKKQLFAQAARLRRFNEWEAAHPHQLDEAAAIAGIGSRYELIPAASRKRPFHPKGLRAMRQALSQLKGIS